jgi:hypothetical protein
MIALNNAEFLALWEAGYRLHPLDRGLLAIRASLPAEDAAHAVADWPLGRRNRALAQFRIFYFGPRLEGWTTCAECGEKLEFELDCRALVDSPAAERPQVTVASQNFRLPTSRDLALIATESDTEQAVLSLLRACSVEADSQVQWTNETIESIANEMAVADPLAEISLGFECPMCHHSSEESLDLSKFLWNEIESRARRLLAEVHVLAAMYGWAEAAILGMSDVRRATYLQMVQT